MAEDKFRPEDKLKWLKEFVETKFWTDVFQPHLQTLQDQAHGQLVTCDKDDIDEYRAAIKLLAEILDFLANCKDLYETEAELVFQQEKAEHDGDSNKKVPL